MDAYESESSKPKHRISALSIFTWVLLGCIIVAFLAPLAGLRFQPASEGLRSQRSDEASMPTLQASEPVSEMWVNVWFLPERTYLTIDQLSAESVMRGTTPDGKLAYHFTYTDSGFNSYLSYWFQQLVKNQFPEMDQPLIDVEPGRLRAWIDLAMGDSTARLCLIYELDETGTRFDFKGLLIGTQLVTTADGSFLDQQGTFVESLANRAIQEMVMIDASGAELSIRQITFTDSHIEILAIAK